MNLSVLGKSMGRGGEETFGDGMEMEKHCFLETMKMLVCKLGVCVYDIRVIRRIVCVYNRNLIMESPIYRIKELSLYSVVSGEAITHSKAVWCV